MSTGAKVDIEVNTKFRIVKIKLFPRARRHVVIEDENGDRRSLMAGDSLDVTQKINHRTGIYDKR